MHGLTYEQCLKLFEINRLITQSLDVKEVLRNLVNAALDLVLRADTIIIYEWKEDGYLHFTDGIGLGSESAKKIRIKPGESITGRVFQERKIYNISGDKSIELMKNMEYENMEHFKKAVNFKKIKSVISAPLIYKDTCIGVIVVDNFEDDSGVFTEQETRIIEILANQAAIALSNSRFYEELQYRNNDLVYAQEVHNRFSKILIEGRGIPQIVQVLARILKHDVSYSETYTDLSRSFPIISSQEILGYLLFKLPVDHFSRLEKVAIEQAATSIVIELIKQNNLFEREIHLKEDLFLQLLDGVNIKNLSGYEKIQEISSYSSITCVLIDGRVKPLWSMDSFISKERFLRNLERELRTIQDNVLLFCRGFEIITLFPQFTSVTFNKLKGIVEKVFLDDLDVIVGVGRTVTVQALSETYLEAKESLQIAKRKIAEPIVRFEDLGFERLWHGLDQKVLRKYVQDHLGKLINKENPDYLTLRKYVELNGKHKETAQELMIHPNTLTYRLKKIEEELSIDLRIKKDLLAIMTSFEMLDYLQESLL
ncbi:helix-turn-helix domain-containing protein [Psychrobacillus soli]|nr:GAF domain-containing protein [Psychrobacillus soli]